MSYQYSLNQGQGFGAANGRGNHQGGGSGNSMNMNDNGGGKSQNPSSIDAMFQGILPSTGAGAVAASPANARQLSGLNHMNLSTMTAAGISVHQAQLPSTRLQSSGLGVNVGHVNAAQDFSSASLNISDEIKRLQQLHQLTQGQGTAPSATANTNQFMQGLLAGRTGAAAAMNQLGVKNTTSAGTHSHPMFQSALQQSSTTNASGLISPAAAAQLMAASAGQMLPSPSMLSARAALSQQRPGPGAIEPFPEKLHRMLMEVEASSKGHIISFVDEGRAFAIHKPNQFFKEIVPLYFRQSRLSSFKRQLNLYGFELISNGPSRGAYFHELFQRDKPNLCRRMRRVAVKVAAAAKKTDTSDQEPKQEEGSAGGEE
ncbi:stress transcription factor B [Seminavis robusta]|uniref:Stress transcription factor B n=1 Tax=Seminavis robusta TaxID=568900 RepID=A0A9N8DLY8_9STRA|nr:stress transcription factor B [Seminavis robusta]|eukprot:Sro233_g094200.1 stress transcription factor B (372) ;mRNA; r:40655-42046